MVLHPLYSDLHFCNNSERLRLLFPLAEEEWRQRRHKHLVQGTQAHRRQNQDMNQDINQDINARSHWAVSWRNGDRLDLKHSSMYKI